MSLNALCLGFAAILCGCTVTRTVALKDAPSYASRETVVTMEGYELHWDDGGSVGPAAKDGLCLVDAGGGEIFVEGKALPLRLLAGEPGQACASNRIGKPVAVTLENDELTLVGRRKAVRVPTRALAGIRVYAPKNGGGQRVADEWAPGGGAYRTEMHSVPLVVGGSLVMAGGVGGGIAAAVALSQNDSGSDLDKAAYGLLYGGLMVVGFGGGLGGGIAMIAVGARESRTPARVTQKSVNVDLGVGGATVTTRF